MVLIILVMTLHNNKSGDSIVMVITLSQTIVVLIILVMTVRSDISGDSIVMIITVS